MNYEPELNFLCGILKKCHIKTAMLSLNDTVDSIIDSWISAIIGVMHEPDMTIGRLAGSVESTTKYILTNELKLKYIFLRLPMLSEKDLLFIGPYLSDPLNENELLEIGEILGLSPNTQKDLNDYYASLPLISDGDRLLTMIDTFCEHIWQTPYFTITEINEDHTLSLSPIYPASRGNTFDETIANMEKMERRYVLENELMKAVTMGQQHMESIFFSVSDEQMFEKRLQDTLRNAKNYCIIMNTLLRKAAEQGGVHPIYIDHASSDFASKIEQTADIKNIPKLMQEMFSSYCRIVRKHSAKQYSPIVRKTVMMIDSDISVELSLHALAEKQSISTGYLASIFKKETGKTVSEYIRDKRIKYAMHLLTTTNLQVQTIAAHCGIIDVQYFSKTFKKQTGETPTEYRESSRRTSGKQKERV